MPIEYIITGIRVCMCVCVCVCAYMCMCVWFKDYTGMPIFRYFPFFPLFLAWSVLRRSVSRFFPQLFCLFKVYVNILYFLLFHLSLSELSVSFCVPFLWDGTHTWIFSYFHKSPVASLIILAACCQSSMHLNKSFGFHYVCRYLGLRYKGWSPSHCIPQDHLEEQTDFYTLYNICKPQILLCRYGLGI